MYLSCLFGGWFRCCWGWVAVAGCLFGACCLLLLGDGWFVLLIVLCIVQGAGGCLVVLISLTFSFYFSELCGVVFQGV